MPGLNARALVRDPEALLLDEPTSALDREAASGVEHLVRRVSDERGLTVVLVTHRLPGQRAGRWVRHSA